MKKKISTLLVVTFALFNVISAFGAEGVIKDGRTLVPVRGVFESLGFSVNWDSAANKASISDGVHEVSVIKGLSYFKADGKEIYPDVPQQIINGSFYLPLRAIGDAVGANTSWDNESKVAHISYNGKDVYIKCANSSLPQGNTTGITTNKKIIGSSHEFDGSSVPAFWFERDSVDGTTVYFIAPYYGEKTIKYYSVNFSFYNPVGDPAYDRITKKSKKTIRVVGPINPNPNKGELSYAYAIATASQVGYFSALDKIVVDSIDLEYMDGTTEHIVYGESTTTEM